ncbi:MAG: hypothetical protein ICV87_15105 [Gemmatimonadetes bacterium]|nr:hypothetical protein [Gemmatimonadota bacterium]
MDILDLLELLGYFAAFWLFLVSRDFRRRHIAEFRQAGVVRRCVFVLDGMVATFCGLLPILVLAWSHSA